jgi:hypothetical protein
MAITYSPNLKLTLIGTGDQAGTWGNTTNTNIGTLIEQAIAGYVSQTVADSAGSPTSLSIADGTDSVARNMVLVLQGALTAARDLILPTNKKLYFITNNTSGGYAVTAKCSGQTGVSIPSGAKVILACNGVDIVEVFNFANGFILPSSATIATLSGTTLGYASASITAASIASGTVTNLLATTFSGGSASITTVNSASGTVANLLATTFSGGSASVTTASFASATVTNLLATTFQGGSASITTASFASGTVTNLRATTFSGGSASITTANAASGTVTNLLATTFTGGSASITTLTGTSANITTLTGTTIGTTASSTIRGVSGTITGFSTTSAAIGRFNAGSSSVDALFASGVITVDGAAHTNPVSLTFAASSLTVDCLLSNVFTVIMTGNITAAPVLTNPRDGQTINWFFTQDGTGSRTALWPTSFKWQGGSTGVLSTTSSSVDLLVATYRSATTFWYAALSKGFA